MATLSDTAMLLQRMFFGDKWKFTVTTSRIDERGNPTEYKVEFEGENREKNIIDIPAIHIDNKDTQAINQALNGITVGDTKVSKPSLLKRLIGGK